MRRAEEREQQQLGLGKRGASMRGRVWVQAAGWMGVRTCLRRGSLSWCSVSLWAHVCEGGTRRVYVAAWAGGGRWGTGAAGSWHSARHGHGRRLHSVWRATCSPVLEQHCATCTPSSAALPSPPRPAYPLPKTLPRPTELPVQAAHPRPRTPAVFGGRGTLPSSSSPRRATGLVHGSMGRRPAH